MWFHSNLVKMPPPPMLTPWLRPWFCFWSLVQLKTTTGPKIIWGLMCATVWNWGTAAPGNIVRYVHVTVTHLGSRVYGGASLQQLLNQLHMALLSSQVQSVEPILDRKRRGTKRQRSASQLKTPDCSSTKWRTWKINGLGWKKGGSLPPGL